jgi:hypothetical protein
MPYNAHNDNNDIYMKKVCNYMHIQVVWQSIMTHVHTKWYYTMTKEIFVIICHFFQPSSYQSIWWHLMITMTCKTAWQARECDVGRSHWTTTKKPWFLWSAASHTKHTDSDMNLNTLCIFHPSPAAFQNSVDTTRTHFWINTLSNGTQPQTQKSNGHHTKPQPGPFKFHLLVLRLLEHGTNLLKQSWRVPYY